MRDHTKLRVFSLADELALDVYSYSRSFPSEERYGLQSQVRRAAVSVAANIVEGCARSSESEYMRFVEIAYASARELQYETTLCERLGYLQADAALDLSTKCASLTKMLSSLLLSLKAIRQIGPNAV
jgi:four helix bundle protein